MSVIYFLLYWSIVVLLVVYIGAQILALTVALIVLLKAESWEVDPKNPLDKDKKKKVIREIKPYEILIITRAGNPAFPVIAMNENRLTVQGLTDGDGCLDEEMPGQWKIKELTKDESYPDIIQSRWGWLSPLYVFRKIVFKITKRHVVRVWFPFFIFGFYELYSPEIMSLARARLSDAKKTEGLVTLETIFDSKYEMVQDKTDHLMFVSSMRYITNTMPTRDGFSLRADVTLMLKVVDPFKIVSFSDWSQQLVSAVDNSASIVFRQGTLDSVYAVGKDDSIDLIQKIIWEQLTTSGKIVASISLMDYLGFELLGVTLNDLIPADENAKKEIEKIMAVSTEGRKNAEAAGMLLKEQIEKLEKAPADVRQSIAAITAAQNSKGRIDWIMTPGGSEKSETEKATLALLRRIENSNKK